jgi:isoleucyl-tRNA synthetase
MRHGEAKSNEQSVLETKGDPANHLTEKGKQQVIESLSLLKTLKIDMIVSSPFVRTQETSQIVSSMLEVPVVIEERIHEYAMGDFDGKPAHEYLDHFGHTYLNYTTRPAGGETHGEMMNRSMAALMDLESKHEGKTILVVTHGGPARMMFAGGELLTEEEVLEDERAVITTLYLGNAEVRKLNLAIVPRDETGAVNLHRPYIDEVTMRDSKGGIMKRIPDVFDCWFESGSMPFASLHYPFENKHIFAKNYPTDFIAEGVDQTRGWFYSLINLGVAVFDKAPYKHVIVNGLVLASSGLKLSKSEKNYTDPMVLVEKYGADAMRYALLSSPVVKGENLQFDDETISEVYKKCISRLENVVQLYEMNKPSDIVASKTSTNVLDVWMLSRIHELVQTSTEGYEKYLLDEATRCIADVIDDISVWYTRRSRERLKGDAGEDAQREAYETLTYTLVTLAKVMAPVMPFIAERVYQQVQPVGADKKESVHLEHWPEGGLISESVIKNMKEVRDIVSLCLMERTKVSLGVRQPLPQVEIASILEEEYLTIIKEEVNVKHVIIVPSLAKGTVVLDTTLSDELVREGDVRKLIRAVQDMRKGLGLQPSQEVKLVLSSRDNLGDISLLLATCKITDVEVNASLADNKVELSFGSTYFYLVTS